MVRVLENRLLLKEVSICPLLVISNFLFVNHASLRGTNAALHIVVCRRKQVLLYLRKYSLPASRQSLCTSYSIVLILLSIPRYTLRQHDGTTLKCAPLESPGTCRFNHVWVWRYPYIGLEMLLFAQRDQSRIPFHMKARSCLLIFKRLQLRGW